MILPVKRALLFLLLISQCFGQIDPEPESVCDLPPIPSLVPDTPIQAFLDSLALSPTLTDAQKIDVLLRGLFGANGMEFDNVPSLTLPPDQAYEVRKGNCLTFAMLFVTLARASGMDAVFNEVDVSPRWNVEGSLVVETGHVNVMIRSRDRNRVIEWDDSYKDFASLFLDPISDQRAFSHYFNNLGIRSLSQKDYATAKARFEKALELDPKNADAWQNYGVYWVHQNRPDKAETSFLKGIKVSGKRSSIYYLLSNLYQDMGDSDRAKKYLKKGERYAKKNPFYHYQKAIKAKQEQNYDEAVESLREAIDRLPDYHLFHYELAGSYYSLGKQDAWQKEMELAIRYAEDPERQAMYQAELNQILGVATPARPRVIDNETIPVSSFSPYIL